MVNRELTLVLTTATNAAYTCEKVGEAAWACMMDRDNRPLQFMHHIITQQQHELNFQKKLHYYIPVIRMISMCKNNFPSEKILISFLYISYFYSVFIFKISSTFHCYFS